jgi:uncharacterized protein
MFFVFSQLIALAALFVAYRWATKSFPWLAQRRRALAWAFAAVPVLQIGTSPLIIGHLFGVAHTAITVLCIANDIAAVPIVLLGLLSSGISRAAGGPWNETAPRDGAISRRQLVEGTGGVALFGATGSLLGWGMVRGRHAFELCEVPVRIPGLPRALDGYVIAQVSDIHAGALVGERELDEGLALVRAARPDLVVVTGDLVDFDPAFAPLVARKLADLPTRDGIVAILGNHDYYAGAESVLSAVRGAGIDALVDEGRLLRARDAGGFALLGVDDRVAPRYGGSGPRLDKALSMVPPDRPRILLSHQPPTVDRWAGQVALQLSGHTHGRQINPGFRPADLLLKYVAGRYDVGGTTLYVNRGFGTVGPPSRIGAPPEVTRFVLVAV